jgi:hypothetical protein
MSHSEILPLDLAIEINAIFSTIRAGLPAADCPRTPKEKGTLFQIEALMGALKTLSLNDAGDIAAWLHGWPQPDYAIGLLQPFWSIDRPEVSFLKVQIRNQADLLLSFRALPEIVGRDTHGIMYGTMRLGLDEAPTEVCQLALEWHFFKFGGTMTDQQLVALLSPYWTALVP